MDVDPLASMRCWALEIELGGRVYDIPALPAADWWPVLVAGDPSLVLDMIESNPADPFNLDDLLLSGEVDPGELGPALMDAIEETAGRTFHAAFVLATVAASQWAALNGALVQAGFRWEGQPLGAALDAFYALITERLPEEARVKFLAMLDNEALTGGGKRRRGRSGGRVVSEFEAMAGPKPTTGAVASGEPSDSGRPKTQTRPRPPRQVAPSRAPRRPRAPRAGSDPAATT